MGMKNEVTEVAAEVVEKGCEATAFVAGQGVDCVCEGSKFVVEVAAQVLGKALGAIGRIFGPSD